jgi:outer membrane protein TolC
MSSNAESEKLSLSEAIQTGLLNNAEIKTAKERINAARGRFWSGISLPQPELNVSYDFIPDKSGLKDYDERTIGISQSFAFPYEYILKGNKYNAEEDAAYNSLKQTETEITARIKSAYYDLLARQQLFSLAKQNLQIAKEFADKAEIRFNSGEGTNLEKLTARVQFSEIKNKVEQALADINTANANLAFIMGTTGRAYILTDSLTFSKYNITLQELTLAATQANQRIISAELNIKSASAEKGLAWSSLFPGFTVSYMKQVRAGNKNYYGASFGISVPIWFMFEQRGKIQEASANLGIAEAGLRLVKDEVTLRIKSAYNDYENNLKQVSLYNNDILPQSEEIYRTALTSYDAGEISYIEFLQAQQTLINARSNYINILYNYNMSVTALEESVGAGLTK